jgi:hypothetical protein
MNAKLIPGLLAVLLLSAAPSLRAAENAAPPPPRDTLTVVLVGSVTRGGGQFDDFSRVRSIFTQVFSSRKWPVKLDFERLDANNPDYPLELRVFMRKLYSLDPVDLTFSAWVTLSVNGKEHDFGILKSEFNNWGQIQDREDQIDATIRGVAEKAADRLEPVLFPKPVKT